jgi:hypothetical protein
LDSRPLIEWRSHSNDEESNHEIDEFELKNIVSSALDFNSAADSTMSHKSNKSGSSSYIYPVGSAMQVARNRQ